MKRIILIFVVAFIFTTSVFANETSSKDSLISSNINSNFKFIKAYDFDFLCEGQKLGGTEDKGLGGGKKKFIKTDKTPGIFFDLEITSEGAYSGKALKFTSLDGGKGIYVPLSIDLSQNKPVTQKFIGAKEFWFYVDLTNWKEERGIRPVIYEMDCNIAGEPLEEQTIWVPDHEKPVYIEKNNEWVTCKVSPGGSIELSGDYKGFVRVPISSLNYAGYNSNVWGNADSNKKFDGYKINFIDIEVGCYEKNNGNYIIFDQLGFVGDFSVGLNIPTTSGLNLSLNSENKTTSSMQENLNSSDLTVNTDNFLNISNDVLIISIVTLIIIIGAVIAIIIIINSKKYNNNKKDD